MSINWFAISTDKLALEASLHRHDHDDGSSSFFKTDLADWSLEWLDPQDLKAFDSSQAAKAWIDDEIEILQESGEGVRALTYQKMLIDGILDPIIVGKSSESISVWDGFHRIAISMVRNERILCIIGQLKI